MEKKRVILIIISILIILIVVFGLLFTFKNSKDKLKKNNENMIRNAKCLSTCPYQEELFMLLNECTVACRDKYLVNIEDMNIGEEIISMYDECFKLIQKEQEFFGCLDNIVNNNKDIIDITNEQINVTYLIYEAKILSVNCSKEKTIIEILISKGIDIDKIGFNIDDEEHEHYPLVIKYSVPNVNESRTYEIIHSEENMQFEYSPNKVTLAIGVGDNFYSKDEVSC